MKKFISVILITVFAVCSVQGAPYITVLSPDGGEEIAIDSYYDILWDSAEIPGNVNIQYSGDNGSSWFSIEANVANSGSYMWGPVAQTVSEEFLVRIVDSGDPLVYDDSDGVLTVYMCQTVMLMDSNNDCYIDISDVAQLSLEWMMCGNPYDLGCVLDPCPTDWGDCDGIPANGCESNLLSDEYNCSGCGLSCYDEPHVTNAACAAGSCNIIGCDTDWDDCTADPGCETNVSNDLGNCGSCGYDCLSEPYVFDATCVSAECVPSVCDAGYGNCTSAPGCETNTNTSASNCGACNYDCLNELNVSSASCSAGSCMITSCDQGWGDCAPSVGCETDLDDGGGGCGGAVTMASFCGDQSCQQSYNTITGYGEAWYRVYVEECLSSQTSLNITVDLNMPAGMDYDLYLYKSGCGTLVGMSQNGTGVFEIVSYDRSDTLFTDDSEWFYIEVRYYDGSNCGQWTLRAFNSCF